MTNPETLSDFVNQMEDRPMKFNETGPLPTEPPHDRLIGTDRGDVYFWSDECNSWMEVDSCYGYPISWRDLYHLNHPITVYKPEVRFG